MFLKLPSRLNARRSKARVALDNVTLYISNVMYEDFLPVSAAGIFQSNLGDAAQSHYAANSNQAEFEKALGRRTIDELKLYEETQQRSIDDCTKALLA